MITDQEGLDRSLRNLKIMQQALRGLRDQVENTNPELLDSLTRNYLERIEKIDADITTYLKEHPEQAKNAA